MSWGHAVSSDLLSWEHLPVAISCTDTAGIFSGNAVLDHRNTSGLGTLDNPPMVAIYTAHKHDDSHQSQALAYSLDEGLTWVKYEGNPVLDLQLDHFRDPKVSWDRTTESWLMSVVLPKQRKVSFYSSENLKEWRHLSDFGPVGAVDGDGADAGGGIAAGLGQAMARGGGCSADRGAICRHAGVVSRPQGQGALV